MPTPWQQRFAKHAQSIQGSAIRELLKLTQQPDVISFGGGLPAPEAFPIKEFRAACDRVLDSNGPMAMQYSVTEGYPPLREWIARQMSVDGLQLTPENILITTGSQQSLDLTGKLLLNNGDRVLVEDPTFLGALQSFNIFGAQYLPIPVDEEGLSIELLPAMLRNAPKFLYTMPTFQNPCGVTLTLERRRTLMALSEKSGLPMIEDDPYHQLRYEGVAAPSLLSIDAEQLQNQVGYPKGNVIHLGSFSKTLAPGLRLAWMVAPPEVIAKLVQLKQGADLHTSIFVQMAAHETICDGFLNEHIVKIRDLYRVRRDVMLAALQEYFPKEVNWTKPAGGLFLWVTLPNGMISSDLLRKALGRKVAFVPGNSFFANDKKAGDRYFRMNFSNMNPELIQEGVRRLADVIKAEV
jgi:2-aminoadipate transaminase